jgi:cell division protein FtsB
MNDSIGSILTWIRNHKYLFVTAVFFLIIFFFDENNMIKHFHNQREIAALKEEVEGLQKQLDDYARRSDELHRDIDIMEKVARERYGMHKEGEEVFIIED